VRVSTVRALETANLFAIVSNPAPQPAPHDNVTCGERQQTMEIKKLNMRL
jgi:hypothetical protein